MSLESSIESMGNQLDWAGYQLGDTESTVDTILAHVGWINDATNDSSARLRALFRQDKRDDPVRANARKKFLDETIKQLSEDEELLNNIETGASLEVTAKGKAALELDEDDLRNIVREAIASVNMKRDLEKYAIEVKDPSKCANGELDGFAEMVSKGGEVAKGVERRLKAAAALGFVKYDGQIVGIAALKKPALTYRNRVFQSAKSKTAASSYTLELGWIYLEADHRKKKQMPPLIEALMKLAEGSGIFATTRASNERMQTILKHQGFAKTGFAYASKEQPGEELQLYIREPRSTDDIRQST